MRAFVGLLVKLSGQGFPELYVSSFKSFNIFG
jgi:hypothetical protein